MSQIWSCFWKYYASFSVIYLYHKWCKKSFPIQHILMYTTEISLRRRDIYGICLKEKRNNIAIETSNAFWYDIAVKHIFKKYVSKTRFLGIIHICSYNWWIW